MISKTRVCETYGFVHARSIALGFLLSSVAVFSSVQADDTEVFFGQVDPNTNVYPNVLFVLDTSGSMNSRDSGQTGTRMERMKEALNNILDDSSNVNVGMMRFNGYYGGASVIYPVTNIDEKVCPDNDCGSINLSYQISEGDDDVEQKVDDDNSSVDGDMSLTGNRLSMGSVGNVDQLVGLRFQNIEIPAGVTITKATLEFTANGSHNNDSNLTIVGEDIGDATQFTGTDHDISDRTPTTTEVNWTPSDWSHYNNYVSPDISAIVQEIVDRNDWCGKQSMAFGIKGAEEGTGERGAISYNSSESRSPVLRLSYDSTTAPANSGCVSKAVVAQIDSSNDDAFERSNNGKIVTNSKHIKTPFVAHNKKPYYTTSRIRFRNLAIPQGAIIESATVEFEVRKERPNGDNNAISIAIAAENVDDAPALVADKYWISDRPRVNSPVVWSLADSDNWAKDTKVSTPELITQVQAVVSRSGWQLNNDMAFILSKVDNTEARREFESYDGEQPAAPKLKVSYRTNIGSNGTTSASETVYLTAKDDMKRVVSELKATGGTPIVEAYYEATQYLLGGEVGYGKTRGHNGNTYSDQRHSYHRVSHPDSYTGGSVASVSGCPSDNPDDWDCRKENIAGSPVYKSPLADSCQTNHIVFLSDGAATSNVATNEVKNLLDITDCEINSGHEACGVELARWLFETDHNQNISRDQTISTYTIGFNINNDFLKTLAAEGGGTYYRADSASELTTQFQNILGNVLSVDTSFVAPGATVNQFNRLTHRNDIYFALFKPDQRPLWDGNLKRYFVGADDQGVITIQDKNSDPAVDSDTGFFAADAHSWWSAETDGGNVSEGGAASNISLTDFDGNGERRIFTFIGNDVPDGGVDLTETAQRLHEDNNGITADKLGLSASSSYTVSERRKELLQWTRGVDVQDENLDGDITDVRHHIGDPMHARPVILNYENGADTHTTIFMATNEGVLHAIEQKYGKELYAFMPQELLPNINPFFENQQSTKHLYGLDGDLSIYHDDVNDNVTVDPGEKAYLFVGMRRGGNNYYAFDVSNRLNPKLMWTIEGGTGDFDQLGQTWSKAVPTSIIVNEVKRNVLIFGGGYDTNQDPNSANLTATQTVDSIGNAIYIVDALTGEKIWNGQITGGSEPFADMKYSIPSDIRVIDINADGLADQMYVGDMGGQLWRFDIKPFHKRGDLVSGGVIADLNAAGAQNARRFYNEPDLALIAQDGQRFLSISIGSGWRAHPLNTTVEDRFYMIKQNSVYTRPENYGINSGTAGTPIWGPLNESHLVNVTDDLDATMNSHGWMLELEAEGEKVMGNSITINNQVIFTVYEPSATGDQCSAAIGGGGIYVVDVLNGKPTLNLDDSPEDSDSSNPGEDDSDGSFQTFRRNLTKTDRKKTLVQDGIPPSPTALITETNGKIGTTILVSTEQPVDVDFSNLTQRTYWQDLGRGPEPAAASALPADPSGTTPTTPEENNNPVQ